MSKSETEESWKRVRSAFEKVCELEEHARADFLEALREEDEVLSRRVKELLKADEVRDEFLEPILPTDSAASLKGKDIGGFKVIRVLAEGGMGTVYVAEQEHPRRRIALKTMRSGLTSPQSRRRFHYEGELLAKLRHPNIAQVLGAGVLDLEGAFGLPWLALELVEDARPITTVGHDEGMSLKRRLRLFLTTCNAVHHAHLRGVLHRDLKGANVLIDGEGHIKVIDFGIARPLGSDSPSVTRSGEVVGTLASMAPEQIDGRAGDVDARIDVYALGVLLHEMICGAPPYDLSGLSLAQAARVIESVEPAPPSRVAKDLPLELDWVVAKALAKLPGDRYGSVSELAADIGRLLDDQPVQAGPQSATYRLRKYYLRNRLTVIACVAVLVALLAGFVGTLLGLMEAREMTKSAQSAERDARSSEEVARLAEEAAKQSASEARTEALLSGELFEFFQDGLSSPDPGSRGRDLLMIDFLKLTAESVDERFSHRPLVAGLLHRTIGRSLFGLGESGVALVHLSRAVDLLGSVEDPERQAQAKRELTEALGDQSVVLLQGGDIGRAEEALNRSSQILEELGELNAIRRAHITAKVALIRLEQGRTDEAEASFREVMEVLPKDDDAYFSAASGLGGVLLRNRRFGEAIDVYQSAKDAMDILNKRSSIPLKMQIWNNLAMALQQDGRASRAMATLEELWPIQEELLGPTHPNVVGSRSNLAGLYFMEGRGPEALELWQSSLSVLEGELPQENLLMQALRVNIGVTEIDHGDPNNAEQLLRLVWDLRKEIYGPDDERTLKVQYELARALFAIGELDEALGITEEAAYLFLTTQGESHETLPLCEYMCGNLNLSLGNKEQALEIFLLLRDDLREGRRNSLHTPIQDLERKIEVLLGSD